MLDDSKMLGFYSVQNGMRIHVVDNDPLSLSRNGGLDDVSQVEKYRMSDEDYDKRKNTLRAWKREMQAKDPSFRLVPRPARADDDVDYEDESLITGMEVGQRCEVNPGGRRGEVAFLGRVEGMRGFWVGVRFDEPVGKGDGTANGTRYFEADAKFGGFIRPNRIEVGDYPPRGLSDEEDEEDDEL